MTRGIWCGRTIAQNGQELANYIAKLTYWQATRVHIWLNDNAPPADFHFDPSQPEWFYTSWHEPNLDWLIGQLKAQFDVVLTLSPWYCRKDYLNGLSKPFDLAHKHSAKLEFDLEGNCQDAFLHGLSPYTPDLTTSQADDYILGLLDAHYPGAVFGITSNTDARYSIHPALLKRSAFVTPQAYAAGQVKAFEAFFSTAGFYNGEVWFGLEAVSPATPFITNIQMAETLHKQNPAQVHGHVVWWDLGLSSYPDCSAYLHDNAPSKP
jgi:hypothetical protein